MVGFRNLESIRIARSDDVVARRVSAPRPIKTVAPSPKVAWLNNTPTPDAPTKTGLAPQKPSKLSAKAPKSRKILGSRRDQDSIASTLRSYFGLSVWLFLALWRNGTSILNWLEGRDSKNGRCATLKGAHAVGRRFATHLANLRQCRRRHEWHKLRAPDFRRRPSERCSAPFAAPAFLAGLYQVREAPPPKQMYRYGGGARKRCDFWAGVQCRHAQSHAHARLGRPDRGTVTSA